VKKGGRKSKAVKTDDDSGNGTTNGSWKGGEGKSITCIGLLLTGGGEKKTSIGD
jgi:hypothetical protein